MILVILAAAYIVRVQLPARFILWYDELHTYYIAQAPTIPRLIEEIRLLDLNPPLIYVLVRACFAMFGVSSFAVRLPSMVAFALASAGIFQFLTRRVGALWAAAGVALVWQSLFFRYATEARPYGLLLAFFSLTLVSWDSANTRKPRGWALAGIAAGNTGMILSHVFAPLSIMPFCVAELVRIWRERRIDWAMWAALLLPLVSAVLYIPLLGHSGSVIQPPAFQASLTQIATFYMVVFVGVIPGLLIALALTFLVAVWRSNTRGTQRIGVRETPLFLASLFSPAIVNLVMMRSHGPFWDRYCLTTAVIVYMLIALFVAYKCERDRLAGLAATVVLLGFSLTQTVYATVQLARSKPDGTTIDQVKPDLPFVANSALTFVAMDHHENAAFLTRVYYLTDRSSSLQYAHTDIFEGTASLKQYFPIRANIASYQDFTANHRRFLILGTIDHREDWLLRKVIAEGAQVGLIGKFKVPYQDSLLYEVTLRP